MKKSRGWILLALVAATLAGLAIVGAVRLRERRRPHEPLVVALPPHRALGDVVLSPDGEWLAGALVATDGQHPAQGVGLCRLAPGTRFEELPPSSSGIRIRGEVGRPVGFFPDHVVARLTSGEVVAWLLTGGAPTTLAPAAGARQRVRVARAGELVAVLQEDGTLELATARGKLLQRIATSATRDARLGLSPGGTVVFTWEAESTNTLSLWSTRDGSRLLDTKAEDVHGVLDGGDAILAFDGQGFGLFGLADRQPRWFHSFHEPVFPPMWSPLVVSGDGDRFAFFTYEKLVVGTVRTGEWIAALAVPAGKLPHSCDELAIDREGDRVAAVWRDSVVAWDVPR